MKKTKRREITEKKKRNKTPEYAMRFKNQNTGGKENEKSTQKHNHHNRI